MSPTPEEQPEPPPGIKLNTNQEITTPNSIPHKPPDLNEDYDLNSGEDLEIVMITQDAEMNDTHDEEKNGRTSIPLVNHNHSDVKEPKIKAMKEKKIWEYNAHLRVLAVKELRKPGQSKHMYSTFSIAADIRHYTSSVLRSLISYFIGRK